jgi:hypothetical protein
MNLSLDKAVHAGALLRGPRVIALALLLTLGALAWLGGLHAANLAVTHTWAFSLSHFAKDALLVFPLALIAIAAAARLADRWGLSEASITGLLVSAALIAAAFSLLLAPVLGLHHALARVLDSGAGAHSFHGIEPPGSSGVISRLLWSLLEGLHDALFVYAAAAPGVLAALVTLAAIRRGRWAARTPCVRARGTLRRTILVCGLGLILFVATLAGVNLALTRDQDLHGAHGFVTASVPVGVEARVDDLRLAVQSAQWVRQPREAGPTSPAPVGAPSRPPLPERLYLDVRLKNVGRAPRHIGRGDFRLHGPDRSWGPLADDFPDFVLAPQEQLHTRLIFEVAQKPVDLEFGWRGQAPKVRIPLIDDVPAGFFQGICRGLLGEPKWN